MNGYKKYRLYVLKNCWSNDTRCVLIDSDNTLLYEKIGKQPWQDRGREDPVYFISSLSKAFLERTTPDKEYDTLEEFIAEDFGDFI